MIQWQADIQIYLHRQAVDFRKSINGLSVIVQDEMQLSLVSRSIFVFCNKPRTHLKVLYWDATGFALWQKRLEKDKFKWPSMLRDSTVTINHAQWCWLLQGIDYTKIKPHHPLIFDSVL